MFKPILPLALLASSLLLAACAQTPPVGSATPAAPSASATAAAAPGLVGPTWVVETMAGAAPAAKATITAAFAADGTVSGSGGCNRFSGSYTASGTTITVSDALASTMMACDTAIMEQEAAFFAALTAARTFAVADDALTLLGADAAALVAFAAQDQSLADTTWKVTNYNDGKTAVVGVLAGSEPTVAFSADGKVSGSGGCNRLIGAFTSGADGTITVGPLGSTKMACDKPAGVMAQESALIAALESAATYAVTGDALELRTAADAIAVQLTRG